MNRPQPQSRSSYVHFTPITTRWADNDVYGHVNNVTYYSYFDSAINGYLALSGALDIHQSPVVGFVVETHCNFFASLEFPRPIEVGIRVTHIGTSSVRFELGVFEKDAELSSASGHFVHVYVNRQTRRPVPVPEVFLQAIRPLFKTMPA